jgi:DNA polymerase-1
VSAIRDAMRLASEAGVTFRIAGAEIVTDGTIENLEEGVRTNLERMRSSGYLWDWSGAAAADREACDFADALGVEAVSIETRDAAIAAVKELLADDPFGGPIGLDIETALKPEFSKPRRSILINVDGSLSANNRVGEETAKGEPKFWRDPHLAEIKLLQLYAGGRRCFVFRSEALDLMLRSNLIREHPFVAHNAAFETAFLRAAGVERRQPIECTMQAFGLLHGTMDRRLEAAAAKVLGVAVPKSLQTSDWAAQKLSRGQICYAATDAVLAFRLWRKAVPVLRRNGRFTTYELQRNVAPAVALMEWHGIGFDKAEHDRQVETWSREFAGACRAFKETTGKAPPIRRADLQAWIAEAATPEQLATWPRTQDGGLSTAADCIKWLILNQDPTVPRVLDILSRKKLIESFGVNLQKFASPSTQRIHTGFNVGKAENGRFSSDGPNLQQMPSRGAGKEFRRCIVAAEGCLLVVADFSQIELRIAAWRHKDTVMTKAFADSEDIHSRTVRLLGFTEVTPERRSLAKAINFGCIYGMSARGLVEYAFSSFGIVMTEDEAQRHLDRFFATYSGLNQGRFDVWKAAKASGAISAGRYGRVVERAWVKGDRRTHWPLGEKPPFTMCANFPISGAASDLMLATIPPVDARLSQLRGGLTLCVHDELVAEVHRDDAEAAKAVLEEEMTRVFVEMFPGAPSDGVVSVGIGRDWLEAKES